jgi:hypothetical protein
MTSAERKSLLPATAGLKTKGVKRRYETGETGVSCEKETR